jgi:hypothetical protein
MGRGEDAETGTQRVVTLARSLGARPLLEQLGRLTAATEASA